MYNSIEATIEFVLQNPPLCNHHPSKSKMSCCYHYVRLLILTEDSHISGFRRVWPVFGELKWSKSCYVVFILAKPWNCREWVLHPEHWEW